MKKFLNILVIGLTALAASVQAEESAPLRLVQTIPLTNVEGRIDHMAMDLKSQRLFVAALGNNTVEVLDLRAGNRIRSITGLREPQGVGFIAEFNRILVASGKSGACDVFDGSSFKLIKSVKFPTTPTMFDTMQRLGKSMSVTVAAGSGLSIQRPLISLERSNSRAILNPSN
jgi:DNA-binding beta-propeller fold protein YncE